MRLYCVDGTNVVRVLWGYGGVEFREQEESDCVTLVESFAVLGRRLAGRAEFEIFFDGQGRTWKRLPRGAGLSVRFAWDEPADTLILDRVRAGSFGHEGRVTVVTADGELGRRAREEGGRWLTVRPGERLERVLGSIERRFTGKG
ncbi:MAG: NYN domain-containing protein [Elusimicrobia bacterium]|nr:NYN domain-containing protein [Elusimicrobiota bacterium]